MFVSAIIAAGGRGQRLGGERLKPLVEIAGRSILERSVTAFLAHPSIDEVVVALPPELLTDPPACLRTRVKGLRTVAGGARRQDSVAAAFRAIAERAEIVVVHDAARPFVSAELIARTIAAAVQSGAALAALQARDTVKRAWDLPRVSHHSDVDSGGLLTVKETLPRESIFLAQTPQAFRCAVLRDALALSEDATDEAALAERTGHSVRLVEGEPFNIKITTPADLPIAEAIAARRDARFPEAGRAGTGYDLHVLVAGRPLVLGGVTVPSDRGAVGHSDADVICHAVTDAILGAACLGDIGRHFPDSDPQWAGVSSLELLPRVVALAADSGLAVGNIDVTVVLQAPKIAAHIDAMRTAVARAIGIEVGRVSIKAKTNEGVDAVGRGEAVAAHAIALLRSS
jgi:2-C-methyl-D-erythritol 4-phosphate cytidylyltransferase/2-C-methyl-D-erythritol 2,4-cyclodiphosphate synthase